LCSVGNFIMKQIYLGGKYGSVIGNYALVDDDDFEELNKHKWFAEKSGNTYYAVRNDRYVNKKQKKIKMHRHLLGLTNPHLLGDHQDRNGLNNQNNNLRKANKSENGKNRASKKGASSKYLGVYLYRNSMKWASSININGKSKTIGYFPLTEEGEKQAAIAYNEVAKKHHGEFANLNLI